MPTFVLVATLMTLAAAGVLLLGLRPQSAGTLSSRQFNLVVLRQQMVELDHERTQGRLSAQEHRLAREDLERRLLTDAPLPSCAGPPARSRQPVVLATLALPLVAWAIYLATGSPQLVHGAVPDGAEGAHDSTLEQLEMHVGAQPGDARAWVLLARTRMQADQFVPAAAAYERGVALSPRVARDPQVWCEWADALALAQGSLAGRPTELIDRALALDPANSRALEMAGSAAIEARDYRGARLHWQRLLARLDPASAEHAQLQVALDKLDRLAQAALPPRR